MKIIRAGYKIVSNVDGVKILKNIEKIGRTCYKSEDRITDNSASEFVKMLIDKGHEAVIEHEFITVKFICDRGVSHELVRHRLASFVQESTRYCNYSKDKFGNELTFVKPPFLTRPSQNKKRWSDYLVAEHWQNAMRQAEYFYLDMIDRGLKPEEARSVLPNSLKTEVIMTANLREWRHFFKLRTGKTAHPQMREITIPLLGELKEKIPVVFGDIIKD